jgi:GlpG protein
MRLVATIEDEKGALAFRALLIHEGVENVCEASTPSGQSKMVFYIWVTNEDLLAKALQLYERFQKDPSIAPKSAPPEEPSSEEEAAPQIQMTARGPRKFPAPITKWVILICAVLFICNGFLKRGLAEEHPAYAKLLGFTSIDIALMYDFPLLLQKYSDFLIAHPDLTPENYKEMPTEDRLELARIERTPHWEGLYNYFLSTSQPLTGPLFEQIGKGQVWRLFTPALLHSGFLHILFNMLWLWLLGRFVERNIKIVRYIALIIVCGIISNTCQYFMSGSNFVGFSGVVSGLAGFIFIRQKCAPWEDYPLPKATLIFLAIFIVGMALLQLLSFFLQKFAIANLPITVANTAHVAGAITGMVLAKLPTFEAQ